MRVLIIDSSVQIIERLQQELADMEHISAVFGAVGFQDGTEFFRAVTPSVILIDSRLKDNQCTQLLREFRIAAADLKLIVLMNGEDEQLREKLRQEGADLFFDKYHEFELIPVTVNRIATESKNGFK